MSLVLLVLSIVVGVGNLLGSILIISIPLLALLMIIMVIAGSIGSKNKTKEGGENMVKNVYVYFVLFATLMMTIGGSVSVFMAVADIIAPTPYYQSYEDYVRINKERPSPVDGEAREQLSEEELRSQYASLVKSETERQASRAKNTLIKSFGWIVIPLPVFLYFQRRLAAQKDQTA
ncbi:MAG: hypothetical protein WDA53_09240 [Bacillota bacterium]